MRPNPPLVAAEEINGEYVFPNVCTEVLTKLFTRLKLCFGAQLYGQKQLRNHDSNIYGSILANKNKHIKKNILGC